MSKAYIKDNMAVVRQQLSQAATEAGRSQKKFNLLLSVKQNLLQ